MNYAQQKSSRIPYMKTEHSMIALSRQLCSCASSYQSSHVAVKAQQSRGLENGKNRAEGNGSKIYPSLHTKNTIPWR
jgi:hypothetical protein